MSEAKNDESELNALLVDEWGDEFPDKEGIYWFYGYRYGKISCGRETKPELMLIKYDRKSKKAEITAPGNTVQSQDEAVTCTELDINIWQISVKEKTSVIDQGFASYISLSADPIVETDLHTVRAEHNCHTTTKV